MRLKEKTFEEMSFDIFCVKGYSIYANVEPAVKNRSLMIPCTRSTDRKLPVLNYHRNRLCKPLFNDLFFWYIDNTPKLVSLVSQNSLVSLSPDENFEQALKSIADRNVIVRRLLKRR